MRSGEAGKDGGTTHRACALLVDDDPLVLDVLAEVAEAVGLRPVACRTLASARHALREHAPAVAIVDDALPDGRGLDLVQRLRANGNARRTRVFFCTSAQPGRRQEMARVAPVIRKPFALAEVERVMRDAAQP